MVSGRFAVPGEFLSHRLHERDSRLLRAGVKKLFQFFPGRSNLENHFASQPRNPPVKIKSGSGGGKYFQTAPLFAALERIPVPANKGKLFFATLSIGGLLRYYYREAA